MELRHLKYFCAVAERRSFTHAARQLHVSQSGVSGQVRDLEKEMGVTLLYRNQREVSLTAEGAIFLEEARAILSHAERAVAIAVRASQGKYGKLSVGLCGPATAPFLPGLIREYRKEQPEVTVSLKDMDPAQQAAALVNGSIDVGFMRNIGQEFQGTLRSEVFFREPIVVALPPGHRLAKQAAVRLGDLAKEPFVLYSREAAPDIFDAIVVLCKKAKFSPRILDSPNLWQSVLTLVEAGEGVALIPACVRHLRSNGVTFHSLEGRGCVLDVILAWRHNEPGNVRDSFLRLLRKNRSAVARMMRAG